MVVDFSVREQCADLSYNLGGNIIRVENVFFLWCVIKLYAFSLLGNIMTKITQFFPRRTPFFLYIMIPMIVSVLLYNFWINISMNRFERSDLINWSFQRKYIEYDIPINSPGSCSYFDAVYNIIFFKLLTVISATFLKLIQTNLNKHFDKVMNDKLNRLGKTWGCWTSA